MRYIVRKAHIIILCVWILVVVTWLVNLSASSWMNELPLYFTTDTKLPDNPYWTLYIGNGYENPNQFSLGQGWFGLRSLFKLKSQVQYYNLLTV